ncbi:type 2 periplasmic-binding domain-containing protein [Aquipseudomonas guryensis]|uniref:Transporter substrate-binding domain-containing protein n=1 Tax=Aquipseudomonas guryensis TaxID=2759165 RepID=A0A7W4H531_9GAMM|nr:transporter substrate-binding domain-containing protein [Pseudomonas guryensis]MBB1521318.1 transporter substrate-binding domain-containing protein [Pseudomonas guryensis]
MKTWLFGLLWLGCWVPLQAVEQVLLFNYQQKPPYIVDEAHRQGLYFDLAERLNASLPAYHFVVREIPRKRLDYLLSRDQMHGLVVGVSPDWFADAARHRWTQAFIDDANLLVSRSAGEVSRLSASSLDGHRLGLVSGHRYPELKAVLRHGLVRREDAASEAANLERLMRGWIDATVVGVRTMEFHVQHQPELRQQLFIAEPPLYRYRRHLLVPDGYAGLLPELNRVIAQLEQDPVWQTRLAHYRE